jgi:hypothetical protein
MRPRPVILTALLVGSAALTGCSGPAGGESTPAETAMAETTSTQTADVETALTTTNGSPATTVSYQDCPYYLSVDPAGEDERARVDETRTFSELSPERQREFEEALRNGSTKLGTDLPSTWAGPRIVQYQGDHYYTVASVC